MRPMKDDSRCFLQLPPMLAKNTWRSASFIFLMLSLSVWCAWNLRQATSRCPVFITSVKICASCVVLGRASGTFVYQAWFAILNGTNSYLRGPSHDLIVQPHMQICLRTCSNLASVGRQSIGGDGSDWECCKHVRHGCGSVGQHFEHVVVGGKQGRFGVDII